MLGHLILAAITIIALFILFLIIARTANTIINSLGRLEYLIQKEYELKKERQEKDEAKNQQKPERSSQPPDPDPAVDPLKV